MMERPISPPKAQLPEYKPFDPLSSNNDVRKARIF